MLRVEEGFLLTCMFLEVDGLDPLIMTESFGQCTQTGCFFVSSLAQTRKGIRLRILVYLRAELGSGRFCTRIY